MQWLIDTLTDWCNYYVDHLFMPTVIILFIFSVAIMLTGWAALLFRAAS